MVACSGTARHGGSATCRAPTEETATAQKNDVAIAPSIAIVLRCCAGTGGMPVLLEGNFKDAGETPVVRTALTKQRGDAGAYAEEAAQAAG